MVVLLVEDWRKIKITFVAETEKNFSTKWKYSITFPVESANLSMVDRGFLRGRAKSQGHEQEKKQILVME